MSNENKDNHITARISGRIDREIEEWSKKRGYSKSEGIRMLIRQGLDYSDGIDEVKESTRANREEIEELKQRLEDVESEVEKASGEIWIKNGRATEIYNKLKKLSGGDVLQYEGELPDQTLHSVTADGNGLWVNVDDPRNWPEDPDHSVGGLFVAIASDEEYRYESPTAYIEASNRHADDIIGLITGAEVVEADTDHPTAEYIATISWEQV